MVEQDWRDSSGLRVRRWTRRGHDRLYVSDRAGQTLGYLDLRTGRGVGVTVEASIPFWAAVEAWRAGRPHAVGPEPDTRRRRPQPPPTADGSGVEPESSSRPALRAVPEQTWTDLAANTPGQAAQGVADTHRAAHPLRSRLAALLRIRTDETSWRVGAVGETSTGRHLAHLTRPWPVRLGYRRQRWHALHAVPIGPGDADLDHLVLGPGGVYTINTKTHRGKTLWVGNTTVTINRHPVDYLDRSIAEARRASRLLTAHAASDRPVVVTPVIAVVGATIKGHDHARGVLVQPAHRLTHWLRWKTLRLLDADQVDELYAIARRSTTWHTT